MARLLILTRACWCCPSSSHRKPQRQRTVMHDHATTRRTRHSTTRAALKRMLERPSDSVEGNSQRCVMRARSGWWWRSSCAWSTPCRRSLRSTCSRRTRRPSWYGRCAAVAAGGFAEAGGEMVCRFDSAPRMTEVEPWRGGSTATKSRHRSWPGNATATSTACGATIQIAISTLVLQASTFGPARCAPVCE